MTEGTPIAIPLDAHGAPDLQALVRKAGERRAAELGEKHDPANKPEHGGYPHITAEEWAAWDRANAEWQAQRRRLISPEQEFLDTVAPTPPVTPFEACAVCGTEAHFGYRDKESDRLFWFCRKHRLAKWSADARR